MFRPLSSQNSDAANYGQINDMIRSLNKEQQTKTFRGPNQINALTTGKLKDLGYGLLFRDSSDVPRIAAYIDENNNPILKVSKSGFDATTTGDANLIFNSAQNVFKVVATGTANVTVGSGHSFDTQTATIPHGLGVTPIVIAFVDGINTFGGPGGRAQTPYTQFEVFVPAAGPSGRFDVIAYYYANADSTNVYMNVLPGDVTFYTQVQSTYSFRYYILQETSA